VNSALLARSRFFILHAKASDSLNRCELLGNNKDWIYSMLWTAAVILLILWLLGFSFHVAGGLIHILLVIAVIVVIIRLVTGRAV
jgi:hypothetical protein